MSDEPRLHQLHAAWTSNPPRELVDDLLKVIRNPNADAVAHLALEVFGLPWNRETCPALMRWLKTQHGMEEEQAWDAPLSHVVELLRQRLTSGLRTPNATTASPAVVPTQYVTLIRMAALVSKSKATLERRITRKDNPLPPPAVEGGGGKASEWIYQEVRPWLEKEFNRLLPERLPEWVLQGPS